MSATTGPTLLGEAIASYGRIFKSPHILAYVDDETYRRDLKGIRNLQEGRQGSSPSWRPAVADGPGLARASEGDERPEVPLIALVIGPTGMDSGGLDVVGHLGVGSLGGAGTSRFLGIW